MTRRKKQVYAPRGTAVVRDQASEERLAEITSGRSRWQQGLEATCGDFLHEAKAEGKKSQTGLANESVGAICSALWSRRRRRHVSPVGEERQWSKGLWALGCSIE